MVRQSKQSEKRARCPRKTKNPSSQTGPLKDQLAKGYKEHPNALEGDVAATAFIPKIR